MNKSCGSPPSEVESLAGFLFGIDYSTENCAKEEQQENKASRKRRVSGSRLHASDMAVRLRNGRQSMCMT